MCILVSFFQVDGYRRFGMVYSFSYYYHLSHLTFSVSHSVISSFDWTILWWPPWLTGYSQIHINQTNYQKSNFHLNWIHIDVSGVSSSSYKNNIFVINIHIYHVNGMDCSFLPIIFNLFNFSHPFLFALY